MLVTRVNIISSAICWKVSFITQRTALSWPILTADAHAYYSSGNQGRVARFTYTHIFSCFFLCFSPYISLPPCIFGITLLLLLFYCRCCFFCRHLPSLSFTQQYQITQTKQTKTWSACFHISTHTQRTYIRTPNKKLREL